ncbi:hypothetical protein CRE_23000 [Caenorhabditis remanei]|uniref:Uncharacterized protein n=1 Tax=Caenorhabditis remanei TaxID=31234 RepID=E3N4E7_CAERE|nr:hypothetical protein CRE_23000 [Caenorhabditis remanei]
MWSTTSVVFIFAIFGATASLANGYRYQKPSANTVVTSFQKKFLDTFIAGDQEALSEMFMDAYFAHNCEGLIKKDEAVREMRKAREKYAETEEKLKFPIGDTHDNGNFIIFLHKSPVSKRLTAWALDRKTMQLQSSVELCGIY